jgi:D-beta-D-heptose 7-phosphate kinase/D-beta-D-heptose 1-phosphate adenosyltransferase
MIYVVGDSFLDEYWYGESHRLSPEAPVPVVLNPTKTYAAGGAGNVISNLLSLGCKSKLLTNVGQDNPGKKLKVLLPKNTEIHRCLTTPHKTRIYSNNQCICRVDNETGVGVIPPCKLGDAEYIILSDYNKGTIEQPQLWIGLNPKAKVLVDPKKDVSNYEGAWLVKPNLKEFREYFGKGDIENISKWAIQKYNIKNILVTMGKDGMLWVSNDFVHHLETPDIPVHDVTGAGDVVMAAIVYALKQDMGIIDAMKFANRCASVAIQNPGTYVIKPSDVMRQIVFTNGCFDLLHPGHISLLKDAKELGDYLIVGLNSDDSVKRLKGDSRPVNNQNIRKAALEAIRYVDEVLIFEDDTPIELIKSIKPDIIVKGGDYTPDQVVGNNISKVVIVPFVGGHSTTKTINQIKGIDSE